MPRIRVTEFSPAATSSGDESAVAEAALFVDNVQKEDSGAYQCVVGIESDGGNGVSETQASAELRLGGMKDQLGTSKKSQLYSKRYPIRRRFSTTPLHLHRPDPAAGPARLAQVLGQRKSNPQHQVDARRIPLAQLGEVRRTRRKDRLTELVRRSKEKKGSAEPLRELDFRWGRGSTGGSEGGICRRDHRFRYTALPDPSLSRPIDGGWTDC